ITVRRRPRRAREKRLPRLRQTLSLGISRRQAPQSQIGRSGNHIGLLEPPCWLLKGAALAPPHTIVGWLISNQFPNHARTPNDGLSPPKAAPVTARAAA